jgi:hypothetical protein
MGGRMIPLTLMFFVYLEPIGSIVEEPFVYAVEDVEVIDVIPLDQLERKLKQQKLRIMENRDERN